MNLLAISGTIIGSKPLALLKQAISEITKRYPEANISVLDLKAMDMQFCDGRPLENYNSDTREALKMIEEADTYLIATPIFQASFPAPLKNLFDLVSPNVFRHKAMGFMGVGGTYQHFLVIENQLKPIAGYFRSFVAPSYVYANNEHFDSDNQIINEDVLERISNLVEEIVFLQKSIKLNISSKN